MKPVTIAMPQMGHDLFRQYMKSKYVCSLRRAGARVCWISLQDPQAAVQAMLKCDGLLLPGGADIQPHLYGQSPGGKCGKPHLLRDAAEFVMLEAFLSTGKPILCICRGVQLLNVARGGTLHQDIGDLQEKNHSDFKTRSRGCHMAIIAKNTRLSAILETEQVLVNSLHHQAADQIGRDLTVAARSEDGIVEALELEGHPFCLGVQWHPEHMPGSKPQRKLFQAFVQACKQEKRCSQMFR